MRSHVLNFTIKLNYVLFSNLFCSQLSKLCRLGIYSVYIYYLLVNTDVTRRIGESIGPSLNIYIKAANDADFSHIFEVNSQTSNLAVEVGNPAIFSGSQSLTRFL